MEVHLTSDQAAFVRQAIENGRYSRAEDALEEALLLWEKQERRRSEILSAVDQAEASFVAGAGRLITSPDETRLLASEIKRRGLARLSAEANT
jgi:putative addiction module CopG family antidote